MHGGVRESDPFPLLSLLLTVAPPLSIDFFPFQSYAEVKIKMAFNFFRKFYQLNSKVRANKSVRILGG